MVAVPCWTESGKLSFQRFRDGVRGGDGSQFRNVWALIREHSFVRLGLTFVASKKPQQIEDSCNAKKKRRTLGMHRTQQPECRPFAPNRKSKQKTLLL